MRHRIKKIPTLSKLNHNRHLLHSDKSTYFYKDKVKSILYSPSIPLLGGAVLLLVLGMIACPIINPEQASAAIGCSSGSNTFSLSLANDITLSTEVTANEVAYASQNFSVTACNTGGYYLHLEAAPGYTGELKGQDNPSQTISGVGENVSPADFQPNQWGYAITEGTSADNTTLTYSTIPENNATNINATKYNSGRVGYPHKVIFAAKIGNDKPADHYGTQVLLSLVAGTSETTKTWGTIEYMQDMTPEICAGGNESGKQLIDSRDNKTYWVAKLKDGNCWMTQNLDYDDPNSTRATSTSGDNGEPGTDWKNDNTVRQYWDPGEKVVSNDGLAAATSSTDKHLLVGNYYSWLSATDGTGNGVSTDNVDASGSICPDGWKLPVSGSNNGLSTSAASGSFGLLLSKYSVPNNSDINLIKAPLYFIRGGTAASSSLGSVGSVGRYWSLTTKSAMNSYDLYFNSSSVTPSNNSPRYFGFLVRCVAR